MATAAVESLVALADVTTQLRAAPRAAAIGAAVAFLLRCAETDPASVRAVLDTEVVKAGAYRRRIRDVLTCL